VIADDLLVLGLTVACLPLEPARKTLMQLRAAFLRETPVGRVANEDVAEAEGVLAGELGGVGIDELLPDERVQVRSDVAALLLGRELDD